jgi:pullulanase/glycogen debranching enzyme
MVAALTHRLRGNDDIFPDDAMHAYHAYQSVNYVTCHDGFTLHDLLAYAHKHNEANGHHNRDGPEENFSTNCGHEGDAGAPTEVLALRERHQIQEIGAKGWRRVIDTSRGSPHDIVDDAAAVPVMDSVYDVSARSLVLLLRDRADLLQR